jgi:hypothetical protein
VDIRCPPNTLGRISLSALHPLEHVLLFWSWVLRSLFGVLYRYSSFGRKVEGWKFGDLDCVLSCNILCSSPTCFCSSKC